METLQEFAERRTRSKGGKAERKVLKLGKKAVSISNIVIPDCWHIYTELLDTGRKEEAKKVYETWTLAHRLLRALQKK
jgi:hypothetical protein